MSVRPALVALLLAAPILAAPGQGASRHRCRDQCRDRVIVCAAHRASRPGCRSAALRACLRDGLVACPPIDRDRFGADVAASMAEEVAAHPGLCVATLGPAVATSQDAAVEAGRDLAAELMGLPAGELATQVPCRARRFCSNRAYFDKLAVQGTLGAGGPLLPFGRIVANAADGEAVIYSHGTTTPNAFAIIGRKDGLAFGIVLTGFGAGCAR